MGKLRKFDGAASAFSSDRSEFAARGEGLPFAYPSYQLLGKGSLDETVHLNWLAAAKTVTGEIPAEDEIVDFGLETQ
jgi:hypothetical protein